MLLTDKYYTISDLRKEAGSAVVSIILRSDCEVYRGHFPGNPISPGVCNIEMIKECAEEVIGKELRIQTIKQCRMKAVVSPAICPMLKIDMKYVPTSDGYSVTASIFDAQKIYMEFKGTMAV